MQAEERQAVAGALRDQALEEVAVTVATLRARVETLENENTRMFALSWEQEKKQSICSKKSKSKCRLSLPHFGCASARRACGSARRDG